MEQVTLMWRSTILSKDSLIDVSLCMYMILTPSDIGSITLYYLTPFSVRARESALKAYVKLFIFYQKYLFKHWPINDNYLVE
jgi:hypothetical protein